MQGLFRNKTKIYYANWTGETQERLTPEGFRTGQRSNVYGPVKALWVNLSTTSGLTNNNISGKVQRNFFGQYNDYTATINPLPKDCDMTETSVLWVDRTPEIEEDGTTKTPYDHVVVRIASALNWPAAQIQRVDRANAIEEELWERALP